MHPKIEKILKGNEFFVNDTLQKDQNFFKNLSNIQSPDYLWIGCSDSRIPADKITNQMPGTIFVHRNIANQIHPLDFNVLSVIYYSLYYLKIKHIIICGHYNCGGVTSAILLSEKKKTFGFLDNWLFPIQQLYNDLKQEFLQDSSFQENFLEELSKNLSERNVKRQIEVFENLPIVEQFLKETKEKIMVYGLIYDVKDGKLKLLQEKELSK